MILLNGQLISRNVPCSEDGYEYPCLLVYVDGEIRYNAIGFTHLYGVSVEVIFRTKSKNSYLILHKQGLIDNDDYNKELKITYWKNEEECYNFTI